MFTVSISFESNIVRNSHFFLNQSLQRVDLHKSANQIMLLRRGVGMIAIWNGENVWQSFYVIERIGPAVLKKESNIAGIRFRQEFTDHEFWTRERKNQGTGIPDFSRVNMSVHVVTNQWTANVPTRSIRKLHASMDVHVLAAQIKKIFASKKHMRFWHYHLEIFDPWTIVMKWNQTKITTFITLNHSRHGCSDQNGLGFERTRVQVTMITDVSIQLG